MSLIVVCLFRCCSFDLAATLHCIIVGCFVPVALILPVSTLAMPEPLSSHREQKSIMKQSFC
jgi:hypothetical protein